jgi:hypothetical protein
MKKALYVFVAILVGTTLGLCEVCPSSSDLHGLTSSGVHDAAGFHSGASLTVYIVSNSTTGTFSTNEVSAIEMAFSDWNSGLASGLTVSYNTVSTMPGSPTSPYVEVTFGGSNPCSGYDACTSITWDASTGYTQSGTITVKTGYGSPMYAMFAHEVGHAYGIADCTASDCHSGSDIDSSNITIMFRTAFDNRSFIFPTYCDQKLMYGMSGGAYGTSASAATATPLQGTVQMDVWETTTPHNASSATFQRNPSPGNSIVVGCDTVNYGPTSVTDNLGNTYTQVIEADDSADSYGTYTTLYVASHVASSPPFTPSSGTFTITCSDPSGEPYNDKFDIFAVE